MKEEQSPPMTTCFPIIQDPRIERNKRYPLYDGIVITILAVTATAWGWGAFERYGKAKQAWLRRFLSLEHGIPLNISRTRIFPYRRVRTGISGFNRYRPMANSTDG